MAAWGSRQHLNCQMGDKYFSFLSIPLVFSDAPHKQKAQGKGVEAEEGDGQKHGQVLGDEGITALLILCQGKLLGSLEYTLIATIIVLSLTLALGIFLPEYLLYCYDHDDRIESRQSLKIPAAPKSPAWGEPAGSGLSLWYPACFFGCSSQAESTGQGRRGPIKR